MQVILCTAAAVVASVVRQKSSLSGDSVIVGSSLCHVVEVTFVVSRTASFIVHSCRVTSALWLNCPATGGGSLSLKLLDYTFVRLGEKFRTSMKHSIPPCTRKVCFCSQLKYTERHSAVLTF